VLSPALLELRRIELPIKDYEHAAHRYAYVAAEGDVYYLDTRGERLLVRRY
jgi:hypothetical protein